MPCARKKIKTKTSWIYGESKQSGPEQHSYFGQTAMLPPGENLRVLLHLNSSCGMEGRAAASHCCHWWWCCHPPDGQSRWCWKALRSKWVGISWYLCPQVSKYNDYFSFMGKLNYPALSFTDFFSLSFPQAAPDSTSSCTSQFSSKVEDTQYTVPDKGLLRH